MGRARLEAGEVAGQGGAQARHGEVGRDAAGLQGSRQGGGQALLEGMKTAHLLDEGLYGV